MPRIGRGEPKRPGFFDPEAGDPRLGGDLPERRKKDDDGDMNPYAGLHEHQREQAIVTANAMLEKIQRTQAQTRTKDGKLRRGKFIAAVLALRYEGFTPKQTAELLGASPHQVTYALKQVRKDATIDEQIRRLDQVVVPLAVDNVARGVMEGDKEYTLRIMDGRGLFRNHASIKQDIKAEIVQLSVSLSMPAHLVGQPLPMPKPGSILGAPTVQSGMPSAQHLEGQIAAAPEPIAVVGKRIDPNDTEIRE